ncbi:MAG: protein kinase [Kofleriaceae bacterium]|nr:protein kinase [Kofleriaceae bacterium]
MVRKKNKTPALPIVAPTPTAPPLQPGDLVGSYRITRQIGAGGMGAVYEAQHVHLETRAAIKVLLPELSANPEAIKRFVNEARAASALKHPRIVTVHECAQRPNGQWFIVLEFVEGGSLKRKMQSVGGALGIGEVVAIVAQTASALDSAHRAKIIHRDIKPDNILLSQSTNAIDDEVTVVDFGIAKIDEARGGVGTRQGVALGTPNYMAPEYLRGDVIDHRVDVYALGVVAWEMLTGESLWGEGDQPPTKIHEQQRTGARPLDPRAIKSHIPPELGAAVASALAFNPAERWPNVRAFALAVAHAVTSEWGETGMETLRRVARELTIAPGDDSTAGRPMPPPLAPTLQVAVPMTPTRFPPGAVPIVGSLDATAMPPHLPMHGATPAPTSVAGRPDAPTVQRGTLTNAVTVTRSPMTVAEPIRPASRRSRSTVVAVGAIVAAVAVIAIVVVASSGRGSTQPEAAPTSTAPATSAIAVVTDPVGASITVDGVARGVAPVNLAAPIGAEIEVRAELPGHTPAAQRVKVDAQPATVRLVLAPLAPPSQAIDAGAAAATIDAGSRRKHPRTTAPGGVAIDPDGLVQP